MPDISRTLDDLTTGFAAFKSDVLSRVSALETKGNRPAFYGVDDTPDGNREYRQAFDLFVRRGDESILRAKAMTAGIGSEGGYMVPEQLGRQIIDLARPASPVRQVASVVQVSTSDYKEIVRTDAFATGWVGETDARTATNTPTFAEVPAVMGEVYANPQATQTMLDDSAYNIEGWLADQIAREFAVQENAAFTTGDGTKKPKGFLAYTTASTADGVRAFGTLQHIATGQAGAWPTTDTGIVDLLIDTAFTLKAEYRAGAAWMMPATVRARIAKLKDTTNSPIFVPSIVAGVPSTLLGYPLYENEAMPAVAANSLSVAFGNFVRGYRIVDRTGIRVLRDPYTNKPYVGFYTTKRVGGMVVDSQAIKVIKFAAS